MTKASRRGCRQPVPSKGRGTMPAGSSTACLCHQCERGNPVGRRGATYLHPVEPCFQAIFAGAPDLFLLLDPDGAEGPTIVDANDAACLRHGHTREDLLGMRLSELVEAGAPHLDTERAHRVMTGESVQFETVLLCRGGKPFAADVEAWALDFAGTRHIHVSARDITDRKRWEAERARTQKLEALEVLAGGLAHELNNLLTAILCNLSLAKGHPGAGLDHAPLLEDADLAAKRAGRLTRQLLTFTHAGAPTLEPVCVGTVVKKALRSALNEPETAAELVVEEPLREVLADAEQLTLMVTDLLKNASEATPEGGHVHVSVEGFEGSPDGLERSRGAWVRLRVRDEGVGINEVRLSHIFDPYTSTGERARGLGLASAYNIVRHHGGHLRAVSPPGEGTTFEVYLRCTGGSTSDLGQGPETALGCEPALATGESVS